MKELFKEPRELSVKTEPCAGGRIGMTVTVVGSRAELVGMFKALSQALDADGSIPLDEQVMILAREPIPVDRAITVDLSQAAGGED